MIPELIPDLGSQPAGDRSHRAGGRLPVLSAMPAFTSPAAEHHHLLLYQIILLADRGTCVNNLPGVALGSAAAGIRTRDTLIASLRLPDH